MLKSLFIKNFTLIAEAEIPFCEGFTAITGETGSGKSVLMKSLRVVLGDKVQASMVRSGEEKACIEATFDIKNYSNTKSILESIGIDYDDEIIVRREILSTGKSRARINGSMVSVPDLQRLGESLMQMHGQSEQLLLRDIRTHEQMLDDFANNGNILQTYNKLWSVWNNIQAKIAETEERAKNLAQQKDFLKFQFDELSKAALKEGEEEALEEKVNGASKQEAERRFINDIQKMLGNENGLLDQTQILESKMRSLAIKLPEYATYQKSLEDAAIQFENVCKELMRIQPTAIMSAIDIDKANTRIAQIQKLKRKYRTNVEGLIELLERRKEELSCLENLDSDTSELAKHAAKALTELKNCAEELTKLRKEAAKTYDASVTKMLNTLGMPKAVFTTSIQSKALSATGADNIEFMLAPNPGEGFKSLQKAVSGGELSRVLLAIKNVMADLDHVPLLIFDEVDSGISGEIGNNIGDALKQLGKHHQVLTITHLQQVASRAQNQLGVSKYEKDGRTYTTITPLNENGRIKEISRMIGSNTEHVLEHAKQLLEANK